LFRSPASPQHSSAFSPDGRWVAYLSEESGSGEVWVQPFPPTGAKYRVTTGGGTRPLWSPDGKELFFDNNNGRMFSVAVTGIEPFATGAPVSLPITGFIQGPLRRQYDLTADGKHFLMLFP
jgi:Tol biopolymer transport system component